MGKMVSAKEQKVRDTLIIDQRTKVHDKSEEDGVNQPNSLLAIKLT